MRTLSAFVVHDASGTLQRPLIAAILPGECGSGHSVLTKIDDRYYRAYAKQTARHWILYRCKEAWSAGKCKWTGRLRKVLHGGSDSDGGFHFDVIDNPKAEEHNCIPVDPVAATTATRPNRSRQAPRPSMPPLPPAVVTMSTSPPSLSPQPPFASPFEI